MKEIILIIIIMNAVHVERLHAQSITNLEQKFKQFTIVSPSSAKLMQDINYPVNYSTGSINLTIPIHTIKTRDFNLPIKLCCNTSGIKLGEHSGWIALGWTLQAEPIVTREKKGNGPDESGYLVYNPSFGTYNKYYMQMVASGSGHDEEADIFYFKTLNQAGKFIFKRPEKENESNLYRPIFFPSQPLKVTTSNLKNGLQIIDQYGTKYTFGDTKQSREYSVLSGKNILTTWKASKIESLHDDSITFSYRPILTGIPGRGGISNWIASSYDYIAFEDMSSAEHRSGYVGVHSRLHPVSCGYWLGIDGSIEGYYIPKKYFPISPINDSIRYRINDYELFRAEEPTSDYAPTSYNIYIPTNYPRVLKEIHYSNGHILFITENDCLREMQIFENNHLLKTVSFKYSVFDYPNQRRLDEITMQDNITNSSEKYTFEYYDGYSPAYLSKPGKAIDYWGYYNGANNKHLVPAFTITVRPSKLVLNDWDGAYPAITTIGGANRDPNIICQRQTLKSIVYPTGLKDVFTYELHEYIDPNHNELKKAGGLRIKEINSYDAQNTLINQRKFKYKNGIIHNPPHQNLYAQLYSKIYLYGINSVDTRRYRVYSSVPSLSLSNQWGIPVSYNSVEEINGLGEDTVKTIYQYENISNNSLTMGDYQQFAPDYLDDWKSGKIKQKTIFSNLGYTIGKELYNYDYAVSPYSPANETLSSQIYSSNIIINQTQNHSNLTDYQNFIRYTYSLIGNENLFLAQDSKIDYRIDYDYFFPDSIVTETEYEYGTTEYDIKTGKPIKTLKKMGNGSTLINEFRYPYHYNTPTTEKMLQTNDLDNLIYESQIVERPNASKAERKIIYHYDLQPSGRIPYRLAAVKTNNTLTNDIYDAEVYDRYDMHGNIVQYTRKDHVTVTLLWGYQYQKLIAEVIGQNYLNVIKQLGISYEQLQELSDTALLNTFSTFRKKTTGLVTSYTYFPTRGIATKTDTRGITTYYDYDGMGRLLSSKDTNGHYTEEYEYHFNR
mgnify:CR=1 FL=1